MFATFSGLICIRKMLSGNWQVIVEYRGVIRRALAPTPSGAVRRGATVVERSPNLGQSADVGSAKRTVVAASVRRCHH